MRRLALLLSLFLLPLAAQKFRSDDPLEFEIDPLPVGKLASRKLSDYFDVISHTLATPGQLNRKAPHPIPAAAVNTLGEPLQGAWWVKRHYYKPMSIAELVAGPGQDRAPSMDSPWTIISGKSEGVTPGFRIRDGKGAVFFIKFDPLSNPEMATGADQVALRLLHALGYHVPENYLVEFSKEQLVIGPKVKLPDRTGGTHTMSSRDLATLLLKVPKTRDGRFRATASRLIPATPIGPYRYYGTRADDPNDVVPHEHRRDLRGLAVISAWIGHDDSRAVNTFDAIFEEGAKRFVKHFILDLGSTLGSATNQANSPRSGGEYLFGWKQSAVQLFSLGLAVPNWAWAHYPQFPSIGRFESERFDPETWVPEYPNPAFLNRLPDDEFWAAKQIMAFRDDEIRALVRTARYSDPKAASWLADCLIQRRDKIGRAFFKKVLPLDRFQVRQGTLVFDDLLAKSGLGAAGHLAVQWFQPQPAGDKSTPIGGANTWALPSPAGPFLLARISSPARPGQVVDVTVRLDATRPPTIVGVDRRW